MIASLVVSHSGLLFEITENVITVQEMENIFSYYYYHYYVHETVQHNIHKIQGMKNNNHKLNKCEQRIKQILL